MNVEVDSTHLQSELESVAQRAGCELLEMDFRGGVLKLVLDREGGVTIDDCQSVSREASTLLDVADFGSGRYTLEVTSPGLDRKLYGPRDYERFRGETVRVTWQDETMPTKRTISGVLRDYQPPALIVVASETGEELEIATDHLLVARLDPQF